MGKKRIIKQSGGEMNAGLATRSLARGSKKRVESGILHIQASYNNTKLLLSDKSGNALMASSSGALGFKGAKKGTPFAAAKVGEVIGEKAALLGMRDADVIMRGVGSGRESSLRSFAAKGVGITSIKDATPMPHNGPRQKKPRRV